MYSKFRHWLFQAVALLFAWAILLATAGILDELTGTVSQFFLIVWLCIGIGVMATKENDFPIPRIDRVNVPGALRMLWWAALWPYYLMH